MLFWQIGRAQAPYIIYHAVNRLEMAPYFDPPGSGGAATLELQYADKDNNRQPMCYTWGCYRAVGSESLQSQGIDALTVQNGYFYTNESGHRNTQTSNRAAGRYIYSSPTRSLDLSLVTKSKNVQTCSTVQSLNFNSDLPQTFNYINQGGSCSNTTGIPALNYSFQGTLAMVIESNTYPQLVSPVDMDPLAISTQQATLQAPDFMRNYFAASEIQWTDGKMKIDDNGEVVPMKVLATGYTYNMILEIPDLYFVDPCKERSIYAYVQKFQWLSSPIMIRFSPNLKLGTDLLISQPVCTEIQGMANFNTVKAHITLGKTVSNRAFYLNVIDKNNEFIGFNLNDLPNDKYFSIEGSPYKIELDEKFANNIPSCKQFYTNITITPPQPISFKDSTFSDILCFGEKPSIKLNIDGNSSNYIMSYGDSTKILTKGQSQNIALMTGSRTYDFTIRDANGCTYEKPLKFTAKEPTKLEATFSIIDALCHDFNATVSLNAKGGSPYMKDAPYRYTYTSTMATLENASASIKAGTKLSLSVHDGHGCELSFPDTTLYNPANFKLAVLGKEDNLCPKGQSASIQLASNSVDKRYMYSYSKDGKNFVPEPLFAGLNSGIFTFYAKNQFGCLRDTAVVFKEPSIISIVKTALDSVRCFGETNGSITLNVTGGTGNKKLWMDKGQPQGLQPNVYSGLADGTYKFYALDSLGCKDSVAYDVGTRSHIRHTLAFFDPSCNESSDGVLNIKNSGGVGTYQNEWLLPKGLNHDLAQVGLSKGTYILQTRDALGCSKTDTFELSAPPVLQVQLRGHPLICKGQSLDLDAGIVAPKYEWTSSVKGFKATTKVVTLTEADTYYLKVTNGFGCVGRDTFELKASDTEFKAYFVMATHVVQSDTVVLVNYNASIDSLTWNLNANNTLLLPKLPDFRSQQVVFKEQGEQDIQMMGYYKGCRDIIKKKVIVIDPKDRGKYDNAIGIKTSVIKNCGLFPNPNDGSFAIHFELTEPDVPVAMVLSSTATGSVLKQMDWKLYPEGKVDFTEDLPEGPYVIHVKARDEVVALRFLVAFD